MKKRTALLKIVNVSVALIFTFTSTAYGISRIPLETQKEIPPLAKGGEGGFIIDPSKLTIPENFGTITERFTSAGTDNSRKLIIQIQDSHCNYEAQSNICKLIESMSGDPETGKALKLIAVEGAQGLVDPAFVRSFPDAKIRQEASDYFVRIGWLTGTEFYAINCKNEPLPLWGVEEKELYDKNLGAFKKAKTGMEKEKKFVDDLSKAVSLLKLKVFSKPLLELVAKREAFDKGAITFTDYCSFLAVIASGAKQSQKKNVILSVAKDLPKKADSSVAALPQNDRLFKDPVNYPNFTLMIESLEIEKRVDSRKIDTERKDLINVLQKKMVKEELSELVKQSLFLRTGKITSDMFYAYLKNAAESKKTDMTKFPSLAGYMEMVFRNSKVSAAGLFDEVDMLEKAIKGKMYTNDREKELDAVIEQVKILKNLLDLRMTRKDLAYYEEHKKELSPADLLRRITVIARSSSDDAISMGTDNLDFSPCTNFYDAALKRDRVLADKTIEEMENRNATAVAVVTGGFHTQGLKEIFKAKGCSYVVVTPRMTQKYDDKIYLSRMLNEQSEFDKLFSNSGNRLAAWSLLETYKLKETFFAYAMAKISGDEKTREAWIAACRARAQGRDVEFLASMDLKELDNEKGVFVLAINGRKAGTPFTLAEKGGVTIGSRRAPEEIGSMTDEELFAIRFDKSDPGRYVLAQKALLARAKEYCERPTPDYGKAIQIYERILMMSKLYPDAGGLTAARAEELLKTAKREKQMWSVAGKSATAAVNMYKKEALPFVRRTLRSAEARTRVRAVAALSQAFDKNLLSESEYKSDLEQLLADSDSAVRESAENALARLQPAGDIREPAQPSVAPASVSREPAADDRQRARADIRAVIEKAKAVLADEAGYPGAEERKKACHAVLAELSSMDSDLVAEDLLRAMMQKGAGPISMKGDLSALYQQGKLDPARVIGEFISNLPAQIISSMLVDAYKGMISSRADSDVIAYRELIMKVIGSLNKVREEEIAELTNMVIRDIRGNARTWGTVRRDQVSGIPDIEEYFEADPEDNTVLRFRSDWGGKVGNIRDVKLRQRLDRLVKEAHLVPSAVSMLCAVLMKKDSHQYMSGLLLESAKGAQADMYGNIYLLELLANNMPDDVSADFAENHIRQVVRLYESTEDTAVRNRLLNLLRSAAGRSNSYAGRKLAADCMRKALDEIYPSIAAASEDLKRVDEQRAMMDADTERYSDAERDRYVQTVVKKALERQLDLMAMMERYVEITVAYARQAADAGTLREAELGVSVLKYLAGVMQNDALDMNIRAEILSNLAPLAATGNAYILDVLSVPLTGGMDEALQKPYLAALKGEAVPEDVSRLLSATGLPDRAAYLLIYRHSTDKSFLRKILSDARVPIQHRLYAFSWYAAQFLQEGTTYDEENFQEIVQALGAESEAYLREKVMPDRQRVKNLYEDMVLQDEEAKVYAMAVLVTMQNREPLCTAKGFVGTAKTIAGTRVRAYWNNASDNFLLGGRLSRKTNYDGIDFCQTIAHELMHNILMHEFGYGSPGMPLQQGMVHELMSDLYALAFSKHMGVDISGFMGAAEYAAELDTARGDDFCSYEAHEGGRAQLKLIEEVLGGVGIPLDWARLFAAGVAAVKEGVCAARLDTGIRHMLKKYAGRTELGLGKEAGADAGKIKLDGALTNMLNSLSGWGRIDVISAVAGGIQVIGEAEIRQSLLREDGIRGALGIHEGTDAAYLAGLAKSSQGAAVSEAAMNDGIKRALKRESFLIGDYYDDARAFDKAKRDGSIRDIDALAEARRLGQPELVAAMELIEGTPAARDLLKYIKRIAVVDVPFGQKDLHDYFMGHPGKRTGTVYITRDLWEQIKNDPVALAQLIAHEARHIGDYRDFVARNDAREASERKLSDREIAGAFAESVYEHEARADEAERVISGNNELGTAVELCAVRRLAQKAADLAGKGDAKGALALYRGAVASLQNIGMVPVDQAKQIISIIDSAHESRAGPGVLALLAKTFADLPTPETITRLQDGITALSQRAAVDPKKFYQDVSRFLVAPTGTMRLSAIRKMNELLMEDEVLDRFVESDLASAAPGKKIYGIFNSDRIGYAVKLKMLRKLVAVARSRIGSGRLYGAVDFAKKSKGVRPVNFNLGGTLVAGRNGLGHADGEYLRKELEQGIKARPELTTTSRDIWGCIVGLWDQRRISAKAASPDNLIAPLARQIKDDKEVPSYWLTDTAAGTSTGFLTTRPGSYDEYEPYGASFGISDNVTIIIDPSRVNIFPGWGGNNDTFTAFNVSRDAFLGMICNADSKFRRGYINLAREHTLFLYDENGNVLYDPVRGEAYGRGISVRGIIEDQWAEAMAGKTGEEAVLELLRYVSGESEDRVLKVMLAIALGKEGCEKAAGAIPFLEGSARNPRPAARYAARYALEQIGVKSEIPDVSSRLLESVDEALAQAGAAQVSEPRLLAAAETGAEKGPAVKQTAGSEAVAAAERAQAIVQAVPEKTATAAAEKKEWRVTGGSAALLGSLRRKFETMHAASKGNAPYEVAAGYQKLLEEMIFEAEIKLGLDSKVLDSVIRRVSRAIKAGANLRSLNDLIGESLAEDTLFLQNPNEALRQLNGQLGRAAYLGEGGQEEINPQVARAMGDSGRFRLYDVAGGQYGVNDEGKPGALNVSANREELLRNAMKAAASAHPALEGFSVAVVSGADFSGHYGKSRKRVYIPVEILEIAAANPELEQALIEDFIEHEYLESTGLSHEEVVKELEKKRPGLHRKAAAAYKFYRAGQAVKQGNIEKALALYRAALSQISSLDGFAGKKESIETIIRTIRGLRAGPHIESERSIMIARILSEVITPAALNPAVFPEMLSDLLRRMSIVSRAAQILYAVTNYRAPEPQVRGIVDTILSFAGNRLATSAGRGAARVVAGTAAAGIALAAAASGMALLPAVVLGGLSFAGFSKALQRQYLSLIFKAGVRGISLSLLMAALLTAGGGLFSHALAGPMGTTNQMVWKELRPASVQEIQKTSAGDLVERLTNLSPQDAEFCEALGRSIGITARPLTAAQKKNLADTIRLARDTDEKGINDLLCYAKMIVVTSDGGTQVLPDYGIVFINKDVLESADPAMREERVIQLAHELTHEKVRVAVAEEIGLSLEYAALTEKEAYGATLAWMKSLGTYTKEQVDLVSFVVAHLDDFGGRGAIVRECTDRSVTVGWPISEALLKVSDQLARTLNTSADKLEFMALLDGGKTIILGDRGIIYKAVVDGGRLVSVKPLSVREHLNCVLEEGFDVKERDAHLDSMIKLAQRDQAYAQGLEILRQQIQNKIEGLEEDSQGAVMRDQYNQHLGRLNAALAAAPDAVKAADQAVAGMKAADAGTGARSTTIKAFTKFGAYCVLFGALFFGSPAMATEQVLPAVQRAAVQAAAQTYVAQYEEWETMKKPAAPAVGPAAAYDEYDSLVGMSEEEFRQAVKGIPFLEEASFAEITPEYRAKFRQVFKLGRQALKGRFAEIMGGVKRIVIVDIPVQMALPEKGIIIIGKQKMDQQIRDIVLSFVHEGTHIETYRLGMSDLLGSDHVSRAKNEYRSYKDSLDAEGPLGFEKDELQAFVTNGIDDNGFVNDIAFMVTNLPGTHGEHVANVCWAADRIAQEVGTTADQLEFLFTTVSQLKSVYSDGTEVNYLDIIFTHGGKIYKTTIEHKSAVDTTCAMPAWGRPVVMDTAMLSDVRKGLEAKMGDAQDAVVYSRYMQMIDKAVERGVAIPTVQVSPVGKKKVMGTGAEHAQAAQGYDIGAVTEASRKYLPESFGEPVGVKDAAGNIVAFKMVHKETKEVFEIRCGKTGEVADEDLANPDKDNPRNIIAADRLFNAILNAYEKDPKAAGNILKCLAFHEYVENKIIPDLMKDLTPGLRHALTSRIEGPVNQLNLFIVRHVMTDEELLQIAYDHPNDPAHEFYAAARIELARRAIERAEVKPGTVQEIAKKILLALIKTGDAAAVYRAFVHMGAVVPSEAGEVKAEVVMKLLSERPANILSLMTIDRAVLETPGLDKATRSAIENALTECGEYAAAETEAFAALGLIEDQQPQSVENARRWAQASANAKKGNSGNGLDLKTILSKVEKLETEEEIAQALAADRNKIRHASDNNVETFGFVAEEDLAGMSGEKKGLILKALGLKAADVVTAPRNQLAAAVKTKITQKKWLSPTLILSAENLDYFKEVLGEIGMLLVSGNDGKLRMLDRRQLDALGEIGLGALAAQIREGKLELLDILDIGTGTIDERQEAYKSIGFQA